MKTVDVANREAEGSDPLTSSSPGGSLVSDCLGLQSSRRALRRWYGIREDNDRSACGFTSLLSTGREELPTGLTFLSFTHSDILSCFPLWQPRCRWCARRHISIWYAGLTRRVLLPHKFKLEKAAKPFCRKSGPLVARWSSRKRNRSPFPMKHCLHSQRGPNLSGQTEEKRTGKRKGFFYPILIMISGTLP